MRTKVQDVLVANLDTTWSAGETLAGAVTLVVQIVHK